MDLQKIMEPLHPPTSEMVNIALRNLKARGGSSVQAIKTYLTNTYKVDTKRLAPYIKKYLNSAVTAGVLIQTKGKGATGSFKLAQPKKPTTTAKKATDNDKGEPKSPTKKKRIVKAKDPAVPSKLKTVSRKSLPKISIDKKKFSLTGKRRSVNKTTSGLKTPKKKIIPKKSLSPTKLVNSPPKPKTKKVVRKIVSNAVEGLPGPSKKVAPKKKK